MSKSIIKKESISLSENGYATHNAITEKRLEILKTYKIYIGGQFPRTESGRYYTPANGNGDKLANICLS